VYRLVYKSRCRTEIYWSLVKSIIRASEERNRRDDITGVLVATKTHFLQVIEGAFEPLNALFLRVARNTSHEQIQIIGFTCVERRLYSGWDMHGIGVFSLDEALTAELIAKYGEEEGGVRFPVEEWAALALINDIRA